MFPNNRQSSTFDLFNMNLQQEVKLLCYSSISLLVSNVSDMNFSSVL